MRPLGGLSQHGRSRRSLHPVLQAGLSYCGLSGPDCSSHNGSQVFGGVLCLGSYWHDLSHLWTVAGMEWGGSGLRRLIRLRIGLGQRRRRLIHVRRWVIQIRSRLIQVARSPIRSRSGAIRGRRCLIRFRRGLIQVRRRVIQVRRSLITNRRGLIQNRRRLIHQLEAHGRCFAQPNVTRSGRE